MTSNINDDISEFSDLKIGRVAKIWRVIVDFGSSAAAELARHF